MPPPQSAGLGIIAPVLGVDILSHPVRKLTSTKIRHCPDRADYHQVSSPEGGLPANAHQAMSIMLTTRESSVSGQACSCPENFDRNGGGGSGG